MFSNAIFAIFLVSLTFVSGSVVGVVFDLFDLPVALGSLFGSFLFLLSSSLVLYLGHIDRRISGDGS